MKSFQQGGMQGRKRPSGGEFEYSFARRGKVVCPQCGRRTFVNYVDREGVALASGECGKCDRINNCGCHVPPSQWRREHGVSRERRPDPLPPPRPAPVSASKPPAPVSAPPEPVEAETPFYPEGIALRSIGGYDRNPLVRWMRGALAAVMTAEEVDSVCATYRLGTSTVRPDSAIFWETDREGRVRTGKVIGYGADGHRIGGRNTWMHTLRPVAGHRLRQCWYGEHLLARPGADDAESELWVVESEKGAILIAAMLRAACPGAAVTVVACGGCAGFHPQPGWESRPMDKHSCMAGRNVVLLPDEGMYDEWCARAMRLLGEVRSAAVCRALELPEARAMGLGEGAGPDDLLLASASDTGALRRAFASLATSRRYLTRRRGGMKFPTTC